MCSNKGCYAHRIRLEKLKRETWRLRVLSRFLLILATVVSLYLVTGGKPGFWTVRSNKWALAPQQFGRKWGFPPVTI
jgi:hypothetical protein